MENIHTLSEEEFNKIDRRADSLHCSFEVAQLIIEIGLNLEEAERREAELEARLNRAENKIDALWEDYQQR